MPHGRILSRWPIARPDFADWHDGAPDLGVDPRWGAGTQRPSDCSVSGQCEHGELAAERCIILQGGITTHGAQTFGGFRQASGKTDTSPAADAGQDRNILLATMLIGGDVSDDAGRRL